jgi:pyridoxamine-phosphate oxidase
MDLSDIRRNYGKNRLETDGVDPDPLRQLALWLSEAEKADCEEHSAMVLSTVGTDGQPSLRVVLLKFLTDESLVFFTNYSSRKGQEIALNPKVSACFFWPSLERQVRVEGQVSKTDVKISDQYFSSRPYESRVSAVISPQSDEIPDRKFLDDQRKHLLEQGEPLIRPENWGGYMLKPSYFEFWQGGPHRLHDRIVYRLCSGVWETARLAP